MSLTNIQEVQDQPHSGGGGLWGTIGAIVGGAAGLALAPFTGGASAAATVPGAIAAGAGTVGAGIGLGQTVGGLSGEAADPSKGGDVSSVVPLQSESAPLKTMAAQHPEVQLAQLNDAHQALRESTLPAPQANQYLKQINDAQNVLKSRIGIGGSRG